MVLLQREVAIAWVGGGVIWVCGRRGPEDVVVVWEEGEQDAEEEACCCTRLSVPAGEGSWLCDSQPTIRKVAKDAELLTAMLADISAGSECGCQREQQ